MNFLAGAEDSATMGLVSIALRLAGINTDSGILGRIDHCSNAFRAGVRVMLFVVIFRVGYSLAAKMGSILAETASEASFFRDELKKLFRFGMIQEFRTGRDYSAFLEEVLRAKAGRTNNWLNSLGALTAGRAASEPCDCTRK